MPCGALAPSSPQPRTSPALAAQPPSSRGRRQEGQREPYQSGAQGKSRHQTCHVPRCPPGCWRRLRSAGAARSPRVPPLSPEWLREAGGQGGNGLPPRWGRLRPGPPRQGQPLPAPAAPSAGLGRAARQGRGPRDRRAARTPVGEVGSERLLQVAASPAGGRGFRSAETRGSYCSRG